MSRLHLSSKSLPGVLEDVEVPDEPGDGVICQDSICPPKYLPGVLEDVEVPDEPGDGVI